MPPNAQQPDDAQRLQDAKTRVQQLLNQEKFTAQDVFLEEILKALALIEAQDFNAFVPIKEALKQAKLSSRDLARAMKPYQPELRIVHDGDEEEKLARDYLADSPLPDLIIPAPYSLDDGATYRMVEDVN